MRAPPSRLQRQSAGADGFPYVWTTWLSKLLTGEVSCEWAARFKAHHQGWDRQPSDFDNVQWLIDHTALLAETRITFKENGRIVHTEAQNSFRLEGATVTISGKPDLIITSASDPTYVLIIDVKTGQECPSHAAQLMIYLYALPKALQQYRDAKIGGEVFTPPAPTLSAAAASTKASYDAW